MRVNAIIVLGQGEIAATVRHTRFITNLVYAYKHAFVIQLWCFFGCFASHSHSHIDHSTHSVIYLPRAQNTNDVTWTWHKDPNKFNWYISECGAHKDIFRLDNWAVLCVRFRHTTGHSSIILYSSFSFIATTLCGCYVWWTSRGGVIVSNLCR